MIWGRSGASCPPGRHPGDADGAGLTWSLRFRSAARPRWGLAALLAIAWCAALAVLF